MLAETALTGLQRYEWRLLAPLLHSLVDAVLADYGRQEAEVSVASLSAGRDIDKVQHMIGGKGSFASGRAGRHVVQKFWVLQMLLSGTSFARCARHAAWEAAHTRGACATWCGFQP